MSREKLRLWLPLFLVSFASLFFEILAIRWVSSEIRSLAYFKNVVLMAAVVGLGLGCSTPVKSYSRLWTDPRLWFAVGFVALAGLLAAAPALNLTHMRFVISADSLEWMTFVNENAASLALNIVKVAAIFLLIVSLFDALGKILGAQFAGKEPLPAYGVNLLGSVAGVLAYSLLCYAGTAPPWWVAVGFLSLLPLCWDRVNIRAIFSLCAIASIALAAISAGHSIWSPYYRIDLGLYVMRLGGEQKQVGISVNVNHGFHQRTIDLSERAQAAYPEIKQSPEYLNYSLPYAFANKLDRVLIVGAGTGNDVAGALRAGAKHIDAVEIDPAIRSLGDVIHPETPYRDQRVQVHINDARAFVESDKGKFDLIVFAYLDSHTAFSIASSLRLDNYLYTMQSLQAANAHLKPDGIGVLSFAAGTDWLKARFVRLVSQVAPSPPVVLNTGFDGNGITIFWGPGLDAVRSKIEQAHASMVMPLTGFDPNVQITTDDWPFLYQRDRAVPILYALVMGLLAIISFALIAVRFRPAPSQFLGNAQFFLLGAGFLLLETRGMLAAAVLFGSTWLVNSIVILIVLLMAWAGNWLVMRFPNLSKAHGYVGIFVGLALMYVLPLSQLAGEDLWLKLLGALLVLGLPFMSAAIVFSKAFARAEQPATALGINIMGAVLGACLEYSSLVFGSSGLLILAALVYAGSALAGNREPN